MSKSTKPTAREMVEACFRHAKEGFRRTFFGADDFDDHTCDELGETADMTEVARILLLVSEQMADPSLSPGPFAIAGALRKALEYGNVERAVQGGGKVYGPSREGVLAGLKEMIEEHNRQLEQLLTDFERLCPDEYIDISPSGVAVAYRNVLRERDAFVAARDYA